VSRSSPGQVIGGKYELIELAGEGGMAEVWRADMRGAAGFRRPVAIKMIKPEFKASDEYIAMFVEEARVGSELQHANIVQVNDFGQDEHQSYYLVMEWVDGLSLNAWVHGHTGARLATPWELVAAIGIETLNGLDAAHTRRKDGHRAPIIHRDVSPENLLLGVSGAVKLSDFGLSRAKDRIARLTRPGTIKGKIAYISPEMTIGKEASPQSDVFAMGVTLWQALAGRRLFEGDYLEMFRKIMHGEITPLAPLRPDVPGALVEVVHHALEPVPANRFLSAREMAQSLAAVLRSVPRVTDGTLGLSVAETRARISGKPLPPVRGSMSTQMEISVVTDDPAGGTPKIRPRSR